MTMSTSLTNPNSSSGPLPQFPQVLQSDQTVLVVDDNATQLKLLEAALGGEQGVRVKTLERSSEALSVVKAQLPDLVLLDLNMPGVSGLDVLAQLNAELSEETRPLVIVLTGDTRKEAKQCALDAGAADVVARPVSLKELKAKVRNGLKRQAGRRRTLAANAELEQLVEERTRQLELAQVEMLTRLARVAEYYDNEAGDHSWRVARLSGLIAAEYGKSQTYAQLLTRASRLHDVGKVAVPKRILFKPGKLTASEFAIVKGHTTVGASLLSGGRSELLTLAESVALSHHERWDGSGYPNALVGEAIPLEGRIVAVADAFDAMTHDSAYQKALSADEAAEVIREGSGSQFDPGVVAAFLRLHERGETVL